MMKMRVRSSLQDTIRDDVLENSNGFWPYKSARVFTLHCLIVRINYALPA